MTETHKLLSKKLGYKFTTGDRFEFLHLWYLLMIFNDGLAITGSILKTLIDLKVFIYFTLIELSEEAAFHIFN